MIALLIMFSRFLYLHLHFCLLDLLCAESGVLGCSLITVFPSVFLSFAIVSTNKGSISLSLCTDSRSYYIVIVKSEFFSFKVFFF